MADNRPPRSFGNKVKASAAIADETVSQLENGDCEEKGKKP